MAFYNDVPILCQTCSYVEVLVNQKQNFTFAIIFWQYFYSSVISSHHKQKGTWLSVVKNYRWCAARATEELKEGVEGQKKNTRHNVTLKCRIF